MKRFIKKIVIYLLIVSIIIGFINYEYNKHSINYGTMGDNKNDNAYIIDVPNNIQVCNFGNSHGYYGFNYDKYVDDITCFNFALPSQSMNYNYRILKNYKDNLAPGAIVMICISYNSFYGQDETLGTDFYAKNKRYYHFLNKENIKQYDLATDIFVNYLPALTSPNIVDLVKTTIGINTSEDLWKITTDKDKALDDGINKYRNHVAKNVDINGNRIIDNEEVESIYNIINLCNEISAKPVLVITPYLSEYTNSIKTQDPNFYSDFYNMINQIQEKTGIELFDYQFDSNFINNYSYFMNTDHLNKSGSIAFTDIVMNDVYYNRQK